MMGIYKPCTHPHPPTPSHKKVTPTNNHPHPAKKRSQQPTPTQKTGQTHPHPAKKRSYPPTTTHTQSKKGNTNQYSPTPS